MASLVFGPVPSRRLGRSLGVDLVPFKTCTYDCIYCQLGRTTCKTVERKQWVPLERVLEEVGKKLDTRPDYITLSGSGEPTLFTPLDKLIEGIRAMTDIPIAVLTNGSLLDCWGVQWELSLADLVIPSLDVGTDRTFRLVNRPHETISFDRMLSGLIGFRRRFSKQYWLEVFLIGAYTTFEEELDRKSVV
jgi:wyosine [tRNA(Phe)-imidazoG37] synthetase (radical SAM superfamily)